jgi:hypothetical protein
VGPLPAKRFWQAVEEVVIGGCGEVVAARSLWISHPFSTNCGF